MVRKWFENGKIKTEIEFKNNKQMQTTEYYKNSQVQFVRRRKENGFVISGEYFTPDGKQCGFITENSGEYLTYYKNGRIRRYQWVNGRAKTIGNVVPQAEAAKIIKEIMKKA